jgi:hypothetical protein
MGDLETDPSTTKNTPIGISNLLSKKKPVVREGLTNEKVMNTSSSDSRERKLATKKNPI